MSARLAVLSILVALVTAMATLVVLVLFAQLTPDPPRRASPMLKAEPVSLPPLTVEPMAPATVHWLPWQVGDRCIHHVVTAQDLSVKARGRRAGGIVETVTEFSIDVDAVEKGQITQGRATFSIATRETGPADHTTIEPLAYQGRTYIGTARHDGTIDVRAIEGPRVTDFDERLAIADRVSAALGPDPVAALAGRRLSPGDGIPNALELFQLQRKGAAAGEVDEATMAYLERRAHQGREVLAFEVFLQVVGPVVIARTEGDVLIDPGTGRTVSSTFEGPALVTLDGVEIEAFARSTTTTRCVLGAAL